MTRVLVIGDNGAALAAAVAERLKDMADVVVVTGETVLVLDHKTATNAYTLEQLRDHALRDLRHQLLYGETREQRLKAMLEKVEITPASYGERRRKAQWKSEVPRHRRGK